MTTSETTARERRDWTLLIFIIPIGIILMLIAGQIAIRLVPIWSVDAGMQSNLDPNNLPMQQAGPVQPVLSSILTPFGWLDTFLTPGSDGYDIISDFIVLDPSETATTAVPSTPTVGESPTVSVTQSSPTVVLSRPAASSAFATVWFFSRRRFFTCASARVVVRATTAIKGSIRARR